MSTSEVSKFDGSGDFKLWQVKIQSLLVEKSLDMALENIDSDLASTYKEELKTIDKRALAVLRLALADNVLRQVCEEKNLQWLFERNWNISIWINQSQVVFTL